MKYYVVVYDRDAGRLEKLAKYATPADALTARVQWERRRPEAEVVVLAARSDHALRRTHGRYFSSPGQLLREAEAIAAD
jgi:hypothetical protein